MSFILKNPKAKEPTLIVMTYYFNGRCMKLSTSEKVHPKDWNKDKGRVRSSAERAGVINRLLENMHRKVMDVHTDLKSSFVTVTPDRLKEELERSIRTGGKRETFSEFAQRYIDEHAPVRKAGSMEVYRSMLKILKRYQKPKDFDDINGKWFEKYQAFMEGDGYAANYIGKNVAIIRELMTIAKKEGLHRNDTYKDDYKKPREEVQDIYLTVNELLHMYGVELPPYLDRVRNRGMVSAFSGLRFSDNERITWDSIRDGKIYMRTKKTNKHVVLPAHWVILQLVEMHPGGLPPAISNQKTNEYLKLIGKLAGIDKGTELTKTKGGKLVTVRGPKYQFITTHTMRRSNVTNMILAGISKELIKSAHGHTSDSSFNKYNKLSPDEAANAMRDDNYFKP